MALVPASRFAQALRLTILAVVLLCACARKPRGLGDPDASTMRDASFAHPRLATPLAAAGPQRWPPQLVLSPADAATYATQYAASFADGGVRWQPPPPTTPIVTQATWYIDPANSSGHASDANTGLTSSVPVLTWNGGVVAKWGTISPRLQQSTTVFWMSSQGFWNDPVYFNPYVERGAFVGFQGVLGSSQLVASGTLGTVTSKARASGTLLSAVLPSPTGTYASNQLIINATHSSVAWLYALSSGTTWKLSQPLQPQTIGSPLVNPFVTSTRLNEVDTWASGDSVTVYSLPNVDIVSFQPTLADIFSTLDGGPTQNNQPYLYRVAVLDPQNDASAENWYYGNNIPNYYETSFSRAVATGSSTFLSNFNGYYNCATALSGFFAQNSYPQTSALFVGGIAMTPLLASGVTYDADAIIGGGGSAIARDSGFGLVYIDTGTTLQVNGAYCALNASVGYNSFKSIIWGPGTLNPTGPSRCTYTGDASAVFEQTGLELNGLTTAYSVNGGSPVSIFTGITLSGSNLNAAAGSAGFGGTAFRPGGASLTSGHP
jgi:hypothetical protein